MALHTPSNLYTGGAVAFDSTPFTAFTINAMARKQAKDEALDEYYNNINKSVNPAGVRTQDLEGFNKKTNEWREFYQANKDAIKNTRLDNGQAQTEYYQRLQDALSYVDRSKQAEARKKPLIDILSDPEKRSRVSEKVFTDLQLHDLSLDDPNRKEFDVTQLNFDPKPFDQAKYLTAFNNIKRDERISGVESDPKTMLQKITKEQTFGEPSKQAIYMMAAGEYHNNPSFRSYIEKELGTNDKEFATLNKVFNENFGGDIKDHEDLAAAYTIKSLQPKIVKEDFKDDWKARDDYNFKQQLQIQANGLKNAKELANYRKSLGGDEGSKDDEVWLDSHLDGLISSGNTVYYNGGSGKEIPLDPVLRKALTIGTGTNASVPDKLIATSDGKFMPLYYQYDSETGELIVDKNDRPMVVKSYSQPMSRQQFKLALGVKTTTGNQRTKEMKPKKGGDLDDL